MHDSAVAGSDRSAGSDGSTGSDRSFATLSDVLPGVAVALGVRAGEPTLRLPAADRVVVVLVDGLGDQLLRQAGGHAPFLNSLRRSGDAIRAGFPSTTATSMGSFGTGLPVGAHGLVGYSVLDPDTGRVFNELSWDGGPDPRQWQPHRTVLQEVAEAGVDTVHIGPGFFDGSGLTVAALRGPRFIARWSLDDRVEAAVSVARRAPRCLVYLYWGDVDRIGHERGVASEQWRAEVESVDAALKQLARRLPAGTLIVVTADHGMLDVPFDKRVDLVDDTPIAAELRRGVKAFGGEPRTPMLYTEPEEAAAVAQRWRKVLGSDADVLLREEAVARGWFGPVSAGVLPRIGDVVVAMTTDRCVCDSRSQRPQLAELVGLHGSRTEVETAIPLLVHRV